MMRRSTLVLEDMLAAEGWSAADMDSHALRSLGGCLCLQVPRGLSLLSLPSCDVTLKAPPTSVTCNSESGPFARGDAC